MKTTEILANEALDGFYSLNRLEDFVGIDRRTLRKKLRDCQSRAGSKGAIMFQLRDALRIRAALRENDPPLKDVSEDLGKAWCDLDCLREWYEDIEHPMAPILEREAEVIVSALTRLQRAFLHHEDDIYRAEHFLLDPDGLRAPASIAHEEFNAHARKLDETAHATQE